jgi:hypothetical protein
VEVLLNVIGTFSHQGEVNVKFGAPGQAESLPAAKKNENKKRRVKTLCMSDFYGHSKINLFIGRC